MAPAARGRSQKAAKQEMSTQSSYSRLITPRGQDDSPLKQGLLSDNNGNSGLEPRAAKASIKSVPYAHKSTATRRKDLADDGGASARRVLEAKKSTNRFFWMSILTGSYLIAELSFGILAGSLALLADALHMFTDLAQLLIGWWVSTISHRSRTVAMPFGWQRAEIVSGLANGCFLLAVCFTITIEAVQKLAGIGRDSNEELEANALYVVFVGVAGLIINLGGMCIDIFYFCDFPIFVLFKYCILCIFARFNLLSGEAE